MDGAKLPRKGTEKCKLCLASYLFSQNDSITWDRNDRRELENTAHAKALEQL